MLNLRPARAEIDSRVVSTSDPKSPSPKHGRCPRCGTVFEFTSVASHKPFPFCSTRCREVDLGNWFSGAYSIPGAPLPPESDEPDQNRADDGT